MVILNVGGVVETASWRDKTDAILLSWQAGMETGNAIVDILKGAVNPSGKLASTFPIAYSDDISSKNFPGNVISGQKAASKGLMDAAPSEIFYEEGIYVGYRYFNTFKVKPAYPFGFGLSYTSFVFSGLSLSSDTFKDEIEVKIAVTNKGDLPGKEVIQLYLSAPSGQLNKPESELKAFGKTKLLKPNESQTLTFSLKITDLASFNPALSAWSVDAGIYKVKIGASALDIKNTATFSVDKSKELGKTPKILLPQRQIKEIK